MSEADEHAFRNQVRELKQRMQNDAETRKRFDHDGDGAIDSHEWDAAIQSLRQGFDAQTAQGGAVAARAADPAPDSLMNSRAVVVQQKVEMREVVLGWETANQYVFVDAATGNEIGAAEETGAGVGIALLRQFLGPGRPLNLTIAASTDGVWLEGKRGWAMLGPLAPPCMTVSWNEGVLGTVQMVWPILVWRRYRIVNQNAGTTMHVEGRLWHPWAFPVVRDGRQVASIKKKWSGLGKEVFTDADNFLVSFEHPGLSASDRLLLLAAAMAIDYDFFERDSNGRVHGGMHRSIR